MQSSYNLLMRIGLRVGSVSTVAAVSWLKQAARRTVTENAVRDIVVQTLRYPQFNSGFSCDCRVSNRKIKGIHGGTAALP